MLAKTLLGEPIVFGRRRDGKAFALRDICPHRAIPLSCGRFDGDAIECRYHGWRFDQDGQCIDIPALIQEQNLDFGRFRVRQYHVREAQGNLWIYMAEDDKGSAPKHEPPLLNLPQISGFSDRLPQVTQSFLFPCFVDHAVVGLMDPAHGPYVHRVWWWRSKDKLFEKSKTFDPSPYGFTMRRHRLLRTSFFYRLLGGVPEVEIEFRLPGIRIERVTTDKHQLCNLTTVTPLTETATEVTTTFYWTMPWIGLLKPILLPYVGAFFEQDRDVVVKQQIGLQYDPPLMLIDDADTQARWYYKLKQELVRSQSENRDFTNPIETKVLRWRS